MRFAFTALFVICLSLSLIQSVAHAAPHKMKTPAFKPVLGGLDGNDQIYKHQWYIKKIGIDKAWDITKGNERVVIAVVDSGVDYNYADIQPALWQNKGEIPDNQIDDDRNGFVDDVIGWNFDTDKAMPWDVDGHGTFIAGIIAAQHGNGLGGRGVCPDCKVMSLRFMDKDGMGDDEDSYKAIRYAIRNGAKIINLSFAGEGYDQTISKLVKEGEEKGVLFVVAAGNDGESNDKQNIYPANFKAPNLITVGASNTEDGWWKDSNFSPSKVHVAVPGNEIWGPWNDHKWYKGSGTSFAAPIVAAIAGLMESVNPNLTPQQIKRILIKTSDPRHGFEGKVFSKGIVNAEKAVLCAKDPALSCLK